MNARQIATGTLLAASLSVGGTSIAAAAPGRPAIDRTAAPCARMEHRIDRLEHQITILQDRRARAQEGLDMAVDDGARHRIARLRAVLRQVDRAEARLQRRLFDALDAFADHCTAPDAS